MPEAEPITQSVSPYRWCERYSGGEVTRSVLVARLGDYDYTSRCTDRNRNEVLLQPSDVVAEIEEAVTDGLIDRDTYAAILERIERSYV